MLIQNLYWSTFRSKRPGFLQLQFGNDLYLLEERPDGDGPDPREHGFDFHEYIATTELIKNLLKAIETGLINTNISRQDCSICSSPTGTGMKTIGDGARPWSRVIHLCTDPKDRDQAFLCA